MQGGQIIDNLTNIEICVYLLQSGVTTVYLCLYTNGLCEFRFYIKIPKLPHATVLDGLCDVSLGFSFSYGKKNVFLSMVLYIELYFPNTVWQLRCSVGTTLDSSVAVSTYIRNLLSLRPSKPGRSNFSVWLCSYRIIFVFIVAWIPMCGKLSRCRDVCL